MYTSTVDSNSGGEFLRLCEMPSQLLIVYMYFLFIYFLTWIIFVFMRFSFFVLTRVLLLFTSMQVFSNFTQIPSELRRFGLWLPRRGRLIHSRRLSLLSDTAWRSSDAGLFILICFCPWPVSYTLKLLSA